MKTAIITLNGLPTQYSISEDGIVTNTNTTKQLSSKNGKIRLQIGNSRLTFSIDQLISDNITSNKDVQSSEKPQVSKSSSNDQNQVQQDQNNDNVLKFTELEVKVLKICNTTTSIDDISKHFNKWSVRKVKAVVGSLKKKGVINDYVVVNSPDSSILDWSELGLKILNNDYDLIIKKKYQQSSIRTGRVTIDIEQKTWEKSAYVRKLLRENKHISTKDINIILKQVGFNKIYHSELTRCKTQLGITKSVD